MPKDKASDVAADASQPVTPRRTPRKAAPKKPKNEPTIDVKPKGEVDPYAVARAKGMNLGTVDPSIQNETDYSQINRGEMNPASRDEHDFANRVAGESVSMMGILEPIPSEDDQRNAPPPRSEAPLNASDFQRTHTDEDFATLVAGRANVVDFSQFETENPSGFTPTTRDDIDPERPVVITPETIERQDKADARNRDPGVVDVVRAPDNYDRSIGDEVKKTDATFEWCLDDKTRHPLRFTRYYFRKNMILDIFSTIGEEQLREIAQKSRKIAARNYDSAPSERIGYIPIRINSSLSFEAIVRAQRGEVLELPNSQSANRSANRFVPTMIDGNLTMVPQAS